MSISQKKATSRNDTWTLWEKPNFIQFSTWPFQLKILFSLVPSFHNRNVRCEFFTQFWILIFLLSKDTPGINFCNSSHLSYVQVVLSIRLISSNNHKRILRNRATAFWAGISLCVEFDNRAKYFMKSHFNFYIYAIWRGYTFKLVPSGVEQNFTSNCLQ